MLILKRLRITISVLSIVVLIVYLGFNPILNAQDDVDRIVAKTRLNQYNPTPGYISIVASTPIPPSQKYERKSYEDVIDCGFNLIFQETSVNGSKQIMSIIDGLDLKVMWSNPGIRGANSVETAKEFPNGSQVAGWQFDDEPRFSELDKLQICYDELRHIMPDKLLYINLIGVNYKQFCGDSPDYVSYLDTIERRFSPQIWSYDIYPFYVKAGKVMASLDLFYSDLEIFSGISRRTKSPFWAYCQSMSFKNKDVERPAATIPYLRFEAFSALAYGAQGIVYWTYGQRKDTYSEQYLSALVNLDGSKTPAWYAARQVNNEIKALNSVFYQSQLVDCKHTGDKVYNGTKKLTGAFGPLKNIRTGEKGVMASHLRTGDKDYLIVVSHDPFNKQTVRLNFKDNVNVEELSVVSTDGNYKLMNNKRSGLVKKELSAGGYLVFQWN